MLTDREQRRLRIFREYSANLALWRPELEGQYACPLCLTTGFTDEAVLGPQPALTEEHCIPRGLGRNLYTLTCAACNNTAGMQFDHHFHKRLAFEAFWEGSSDVSITSKIEVYEKKLAVSVTRRAGPPPAMNLRVLGNNCNPKDIEYVQRLMQEGQLFEAMRMQIGSKYLPSAKKFRVAVLKAGYLLMFRHFGYGYILDAALDGIRSQISDWRSSSVPLDAVVFRSPLDALPPEISKVTAPEGLGGFAVPIPVLKYSVGVMAILPSDRNNYDRSAQLKASNDGAESIKLKYLPIPFNRSLLTERPFGWNTATAEDAAPVDDSQPS